MASDFKCTAKVIKVLPESQTTGLGLVIGWGMVCSKNGRPYRDTDRERITPGEMIKAVTEFARHSERPTDEMHNDVPDGMVTHSFPMTDEIAKAYGITFVDSPDQVTEGWMIMAQPSPEVFAKFEDGTYTGFSVGGTVDGWESDPVKDAA